VMLYQGNARLLGTREEFRASSDQIVQQFINGRSSGPMET
jgi:phospholipid/cholesterol/gamma-HCH transport system ATP-binding protein